jgi:general secretion pathway protein G
MGHGGGAMTKGKGIMKNVTNQMQRNLRSVRAFTLIELLLVLVILGVLAAIVVPKFTDRTKDAKIAAAKANISSLETALDAFEVDTGRYPNSDEGLAALVYAPSDVEGWHGPYIKNVPLDPWGHEYYYLQPGENNASTFDLASYGPDGVVGGGDDVMNWVE